MTHRVIAGDIHRFCEHYHGERFHAVLCDAPYEMGFMGRDWDASGVSFNPDTWRGISKLLYPGAFLFVMAGTVNDDLISVAMREAGLRKHHNVLGWAFGSGFPKGTRIDTQVDADAGVEREIIGSRISAFGAEARGEDFLSRPDGGGGRGLWGGDSPKGVSLTCATVPLAKSWEGHRYGGQSLKPAIETVLVFQKPYDGRAVDSITSSGAGALNIDGARIGINPQQDDMLREVDRKKRVSETWENGSGFKNETNSLTGVRDNGRWPANFFLEHHPGCRPSGAEQVLEWDCVPECPVRRLGEQGGSNLSTGGINPGKLGERIYGKYDGETIGQNAGGLGDSGAVSRYFFQSHYLYERLEQADPIFYCAKASRKERDAGLEKLPSGIRNRVNPGGLENEPRFAPVVAKNTHPTVKSIALTKWLATLLLPPPDYAPRRLLVPFCGSGSEMIGALLAGWETIVGVELLRQNVDIAMPRLDWWQKWIDMGCNDADVILRDGLTLEQDTPPEQLHLF